MKKVTVLMTVLQFYPTAWWKLLIVWSTPSDIPNPFCRYLYIICFDLSSTPLKQYYLRRATLKICQSATKFLCLQIVSLISFPVLLERRLSKRGSLALFKYSLTQGIMSSIKIFLYSTHMISIARFDKISFSFRLSAPKARLSRLSIKTHSMRSIL